MNRFVLKIAAATLCLLLLCGAFVGCGSKEEEAAPATNQSGSQSTKVTLSPTQPRPTSPSAVPTDDDCVLLGNWTVESQKTEMVMIEFKKDGTVTMTYSNAQIKAGIFTIDGDVLTITASGASIAGNFAVGDESVTFNTYAGDAMVFTKVTAE